MTVQQLIAVLHNFPPDFNVFCAGRPNGTRVAPPSDIVINLYHPQCLELIGDGDENEDGEFKDGVVIYPVVAVD